MIFVLTFSELDLAARNVAGYLAKAGKPKDSGCCCCIHPYSISSSDSLAVSTQVQLQSRRFRRGRIAKGSAFTASARDCQAQLGT
jgi:hypothetical protein